ncbi:MAG: hypothetical protein VCB42_07470 [Myxococcota bacterium]
MKRTLWVFSAILCVSLLAVASSHAGEDWITFNSPEGKFSVEVPSQPKQSKTKMTSFIGTVTNHIFVIWSGDEKFTVDYSDLPGFAVAFAGADTIIDHAKSAMAKQTLAKVQSFTDVTVGKYKGKKFIFDMPPMKGKPAMHAVAYFFLVGHRLYVIDAEVPRGDGEERADRFLDSISFNH